MKIMIINGPNLNMLGIREKDIYGSKTYNQLCEYLIKETKPQGLDITILQSNIEGEIINYLHKAYIDKYKGIVINPGAFTHYSYAIYDAIKSIDLPTIEVHLSNIYSREEFRQKSVTSKACIGQISGFGYMSYILAISALQKNIML